MKILLVTHHLEDYAGTETYVYTVTQALIAQGHQVTIYTPLIGEMAKKISALGVFVSDDINLVRDYCKYDIIHCQHNTTAIIARYYFPDTPMVLMVHGVLPFLEQPPAIELGVHKYIAVSEEVTNHLKSRYNIHNIELLHNGIDIKRFKALKKINKVLKNVLVMSNHYTDEVKNNVESACKSLGLNIKHIGYPNMVWNTESFINEADLVITLARGALESMSCERAVLIYDIHGGDGMITPDLFHESIKCNLSGRRFAIKYDVEQLIEEMKKYDPEMGEINREIVVQNFSIERHVEKLVEIYKEAIAQDQTDVRIPPIVDYFFFYQQNIKNKNQMIDLLKKEGQTHQQLESQLKSQLNLKEEQINQYRSELDKARVTIKDNEQQIQDLNSRIGDLLEQIEYYRHRIADMENKTASLEETLNQILNSKLWKFASFFRRD
jgi:hypothetical protein